MKKLSKRQLHTIAGVLAGAVGGFLYWKFIGCSSGTCPITSNWYMSTGYGAMMGGLAVNAFGKEEGTETKKN